MFVILFCTAEGCTGFEAPKALDPGLSQDSSGEPGVLVDEKISASLAPCYSENLIKSYGPVPVFDKDHRVISQGIMSDFRSFIERDTLYRNLNDLHEATKDPVDKQYSYPSGPVIAYGYDAMGSVVIGIYEKETIDEKTMNEIYSTIAAESKKQGIDDVPVIFCREPMPRLDLGRTDLGKPVPGGV
jgi:hypothetical protein